MPKKSEEPWEKPAPKKSKHTKLTPASKAKAKASAKKAGRPYPSLVDNMNAAKAQKKKSTGSKKTPVAKKTKSGSTKAKSKSKSPTTKPSGRSPKAKKSATAKTKRAQRAA